MAAARELNPALPGFNGTLSHESFAAVVAEL